MINSNEGSASHDGSIRFNDPLRTRGVPRGIGKEGRRFQGGIGSGMMESADVKLFAEEVGIDVGEEDSRSSVMDNANSKLFAEEE